MADRKPETPFGIVCAVCGEDKPHYNFFHFTGKYDESFFTRQRSAKSNVCFACGGPYRCIYCGDVKDASEYRVQGRVCKSCRVARKSGRIRNSVATKTRQTPAKVLEGVHMLKTPEKWGDA